MKNLTIEVHQRSGKTWVADVRERATRGKVLYVSDYHCSATFAFLECLDWLHGDGSAQSGFSVDWKRSNEFDEEDCLALISA